MRQILTGIAYLHEEGYVHRDIKPENILVNSVSSPTTVKICDLGSVKRVYDPSNPNIQTLGYRAPELIFGDPHYDKSIDIWSIGCILLELHILVPFFDAMAEDSYLLSLIASIGLPSTEILEGYVRLNDSTLDSVFMRLLERYRMGYESNQLEKMPCIASNPDLADLLKWMLSWDPSERPSVEECANHHYFENSVV